MGQFVKKLSPNGYSRLDYVFNDGSAIDVPIGISQPSHAKIIRLKMGGPTTPNHSFKGESQERLLYLAHRKYLELLNEGIVPYLQNNSGSVYPGVSIIKNVARGIVYEKLIVTHPVVETGKVKVSTFSLGREDTFSPGRDAIIQKGIVIREKAVLAFKSTLITLVMSNITTLEKLLSIK